MHPRRHRNRRARTRAAGDHGERAARGGARGGARGDATSPRRRAVVAATFPAMHFLLQYELVPDYLERRVPLRARHLELGRAAVARGEIVVAGAFDPPDGASLLFSCEDESIPRAFAENDPYVIEGLVTSWRIRRWKTVIGADASTRIDDFGTPPRTREEATRARLLGFLKTARFWTVSSIAETGAPSSAVVGVAGADDLSFVFDTLGTTRKAANLRRDPRVSLVMWAGGATAQIDGVAEEPTGAARDDAKRSYFSTFADGPDREGWPDITYFRVRPTWIRVSDFGDAPSVVELDAAAVTGLAG
jgi:uncharacterized protein YciI